MEILNSIDKLQRTFLRDGKELTDIVVGGKELDLLIEASRNPTPSKVDFSSLGVEIEPVRYGVAVSLLKDCPSHLEGFDRNDPESLEKLESLEFEPIPTDSFNQISTKI